MKTRLSLSLLALAIALPLAGCGTGGWFGKDEPPPLPGVRKPALRAEQALEVDSDIASVPVELPEAVRNRDWAQPGGQPSHAMGHLALGADPKQAWRVDIGSGNSDAPRLMAHPVVHDGTVYAMDADFTVTAYKAEDGKRLWSRDVENEDESGRALGGGLSYDDGHVYVSTGYGEVLSLNADKGDIQWRHSVSTPVRAAPTVANGRVLVITIDNRLVALSQSDGSLMWDHSGILEGAGLLGGSSVAVDGGIVVVPYSSGEVFALREETGRAAWSDVLSGGRRGAGLGSLGDIEGFPVMDRGLVLVASQSGRTAAIDLRSGNRAWEVATGTLNTLWPAGEFVYEISSDNELMALTRRGGRVRWKVQLDRWEDAKDKSGELFWSGPVLAGNRLWIAGSNGRLLGVSPADGAVDKTLSLPAGTTTPPIVADGTLYVVTDNGYLAAYR